MSSLQLLTAALTAIFTVTLFYNLPVAVTALVNLFGYVGHIICAPIYYHNEQILAGLEYIQFLVDLADANLCYLLFLITVGLILYYRDAFLRATKKL